MYRPLELFIGLRYTAAKRRNHFISFISLISMLGIALGVTAVITVVSVMNGFERELRARILGMTSHATVYGVGDELTNWAGVQRSADRHPQVAGSAPFIQRESMLAKGQQVTGVFVRGLLPTEEPKVSDVGEHMVEGDLSDLAADEFNIVLGQGLADFLGVAVGDKVTLITPQAITTPAGIVPRFKRFTVVGLFEIGMWEYDRGVALIHLDDAATLFRMGEGVTGVRLRLEDMFQARQVAREVALSLAGVYRVGDWTREHSNFFKAIATEKVVMFIIMFLIVAVAAFNIVSTLVMMVTDKEADIAILRTLGATPLSIMGVFIVQGALIGIIGTVLGGVGGVALALNVDTVVPAIEGFFGTKFLDPEIYLISDLRGDVQWQQVALATSAAFLASALATLYPAWRAARTQPAEALRYE
jgi:lipoprotein-releasing system permease protein